MYSIMLDKVSKSYQTNNYVVKAVNQADFAADKGTSVAIIGPSGSGKSTLLNMMGLIIYPDFGRILINGEDVTNLPDTALCHFRNSYFGYVVQDFALIERESVFNNIRIPLLYNKKIKRGEHKERIHRAAESLLIQDKLHRKVEQLSGGERQRVAIVDGHNRYRIAQAHPGIEFRTHEKQFSNRYEALSWICKNQLGRRNLTPQQKKYLIGERYDAEKKAHGGDRKSGQVKSTVQNEPLISSHMTRAQIAEDTKTSESYVMRADLYAKGVNAAEEVLPGIKNDLLLGKYKPRETDVAAIAKAAPEERREKAEQLRVIPEKKPKADKESARSGTKRQQEVYATIDKSYEDMKDSKRVTEDSALVSLRYTARNMVETCDVLFTNFPGLLEKPDYKDQVIEIMQEPKQYILKLEGETDNEQH